MRLMVVSMDWSACERHDRSSGPHITLLDPMASLCCMDCITLSFAVHVSILWLVPANVAPRGMSMSAGWFRVALRKSR